MLTFASVCIANKHVTDTSSLLEVYTWLSDPSSITLAMFDGFFSIVVGVIFTILQPFLCQTKTEDKIIHCDEYFT